MNAINILSKCREIQRWKEQLLHRKWLAVNEDIAFKKIIHYTETIEL